MVNIGSSDGQTPLTPDERAQLIPSHIFNRRELDELEAENIGEAMAWLARRPRRNLLSVGFMRELHRRMYVDVWRWAGNLSLEYGRSLGVDANQIEPQLRNLIDDTNYWIENDSFNDAHELLANFHNRLTWVHPFPNGNGRWARQMTDLLARRIDSPAINWGGVTHGSALHQVGEVDRDVYIEALRAADNHDPRALTDLIHTWSTR